MRAGLLFLSAAALLGAVVAGCSHAEDSGVPSSVTSELQGLSGAAQAAGGDWAKLSAGDQAKFVARAGSEAEARKMVAQMASKPGSRGGK